MRILYITVSMPYSHKEAFLIEEALFLQSNLEKFIIVPRSPGRRCLNADALPLLSSTVYQPLVSFQIVGSALIMLFTRPFSCLRAAQSIMHKQPLGHFVKNLLVLPKALWLARYTQKEGFDHIHCHWGLTTSTMAMIASRASGVPWSMTCHRGDIADNNLLAAKIRSASFTRFISHDGMKMASVLVKNSLLDRCYVGRLGVRLPSQVKPFENSVPLIVCPANLLPVKGHKYLIEAADILRNKKIDFKMLIAGSGPLESELKALVSAMGLASIVAFAGQIPHNELLTLYREGKVFAVVLPSVDLGCNVREGVPVSLIEALAHGIPVVSTSTGGIPELLDGVGILVRDKSGADLADALEKLISDEQLRQSLIKKGLQRVQDQYDVQKNTFDLLEKIRAASKASDN